MEVLSIILTGLLAAIAPTGLILDQVVADRLRSQVAGVEQLAVRIDNNPSFNSLQGKVQRIRIASRGLQPIPGLRIEALELEVESLDVDLGALTEEGLPFLQTLEQPLHGGVRLVLTEADLNQSLESPAIKSLLQANLNRLLPQQGSFRNRTYEVLNLRLALLDQNRVGIQIQLRPLKTASEDAEPFELTLEVGLEILAGRYLQLKEPVGTLNGRPLSRRLLQGLAEGMSQRLDLSRLEQQGLLLRFLQWEIDEQTLKAAAVFRLEASSSVAGDTKSLLLGTVE